jgi:hypothetical protein
MSLSYNKQCQGGTMAKKEKKSLIIMDWIQIGFTGLIMMVMFYLLSTMHDTSSEMICLAFVTADALFAFTAVMNLMSDRNIKIKRVRQQSLTPKKAL